ncbi:MAG: DNA helicase RecQ [Chloroflexi bacterium]|nr:MAG: DNA helicase RecQ [Chloroflexota bacterium]
MLKSTFGYSSFRPLQQEIVQSIVNGQDVFVLMPTGGGKSLCYQLPALLLRGTTVVVSPLIALMKDQVDALRTLGVAATYINSSLQSAEVSKRQAALMRGDVRLLYVAPERLMMPGFLRLLSTLEIAFFAIDEAHCISEWGHDFRPEYRALKQIRSDFPGVPLGAFTATATPRVGTDIKTQLGLEGARAFCASFNRPNLQYEVRSKKGSYHSLVTYLRDHHGASGIVYCMSRAATDGLAERLRADGFRATSYHAGLTPEERRTRQESFIRDDIQIIIATIAFGMGIDKPDVRFVFHYDLPKTLEGYYQESGRAGRDGDPSDCILFYSYGDVARHRHFIDEKPSREERQIATWQLRQMADWAEMTSCRRQALLAYFDELFGGQDGPCCDNCLSPSEQEDFTVPAQMLLSCVKRTGERFGVAHVIQVLRGSRAQRILDLHHDKLSTYGIGRGRPEDEWRYISAELVRSGCLRQAPEEFNAIKVTERGHSVLFKGEQVFLAARQAPEGARHDGAGRVHPVLFERLRSLRKRLADKLGVPPYAVLLDNALDHMTAALPASRDQLLRIPGVTERKADDFGDPFLEDIAAFVGETGAKPVRAVSDGAFRKTLGDSAWTTFAMFRDGQDIASIAKTRSLARSTVEGHLAEAADAGEAVDIGRVVPEDKQHSIASVMSELGDNPLSPIMERLGDGYTYGEIRMVRAKMRNAALADLALDSTPSKLP